MDPWRQQWKLAFFITIRYICWVTAYNLECKYVCIFKNSNILWWDNFSLIFLNTSTKLSSGNKIFNGYVNYMKMEFYLNCCNLWLYSKYYIMCGSIHVEYACAYILFCTLQSHLYVFVKCHFSFRKLREQYWIIISRCFKLNHNLLFT